MLHAHKLAGVTAPAHQAEGRVEARVRGRVLRLAGVVFGFALLLVLGSIWAVANVQYFDAFDAGSIATAKSPVSPPAEGPSKLFAQGR